MVHSLSKARLCCQVVQLGSLRWTVLMAEEAESLLATSATDFVELQSAVKHVLLGQLQQGPSLDFYREIMLHHIKRSWPPSFDPSGSTAFLGFT